MSMRTWKIHLKETNLRWKVTSYKIAEGRVTFTDRMTGLEKSFPSDDVHIEEVEE